MNKDIAKWLNEAETSVHYSNNGKGNVIWEQRYIELYAELEKAHKIIDKLID